VSAAAAAERICFHSAGDGVGPSSRTTDETPPPPPPPPWVCGRREEGEGAMKVGSYSTPTIVRVAEPSHRWA
jgi:hypothetical protein